MVLCRLFTFMLTMKNPNPIFNALLLFFLLNIFPAQAQLINEANGKFGLLYKSGTVALPCTYDSVKSFMIDSEIMPVYAFKSKGKYGIFNMQDSSRTECVYDEITNSKYGYLLIRKASKYGFIGEDTNHIFFIAEPAYDQIYSLFGPSDVPSDYDQQGITARRQRNFCVKNDSLYGVVSFYTGKEFIPLKYKHLIEKSSEGPFYTSIDRRNSRQIFINPKTLAEFPTTFLCKVVFRPDYNLFVATDGCCNNELTTNVNVWNYTTGKLTWHYLSQTSDVKTELYSAEIIGFTEEFDPRYKNVPKEQTRFTFYNITNGAQLFTWTGGSEATMITRREENPFRIEIWVSKTYSGKREKVGEILK